MKLQVEFSNGSWTHVVEFDLPKVMSFAQCVDYVYFSSAFNCFFAGGYYLKSFTIL